MEEYTKDMPKDVKVVWSVGIGVLISVGIVFIGLPAAILLIAFPKSLFLIAFLLIIAVVGYIKGK